MGVTKPTEVPAVTIGGREIRLQSFKAFKSAHVAAMVSEVTAEAEQIAESYTEFVRDYRANHQVKVTEAIATVRGWDVPEGQWLTDENGGRYIELPETPPDERVMMHVFGDAYRLARLQVIRILALLVVDNDRLAAAEDESPEAVGALLDTEGKAIMRSAETWEIIDLLDAARCLLARELEVRAGKAGKLRGLWSMTRSSGRPQPERQPDTDPEPTTQPPVPTTPTGTSTGSPTSPEPSTDGRGGTPSTARPTATSSIL